MDGKAMVITGGAGPMTTAIAIRDASSFLRDLVKRSGKMQIGYWIFVLTVI